MNILALCHNFEHHGTWFRANHICRYLAQRGHSVDLLTIDREQAWRGRVVREGRLTRAACPHYSLFFDKQEGWGLLDWLYRLRWTAGKKYGLVLAFGHKPDIRLIARHCHFWQNSLVIADWCDLWSGGQGLIENVIMPGQAFRMRHPLKRFAQRLAFGVEARLERGACRNSAATLTISEFLRGRCLELGADERRVRTIYSGCDCAAIRPQDKIECRAALQLERDAPILGYIGNTHPDERLLLEAFAAVAAARPDVLLLMAGAPLQHDPRRFGAAVPERLRHLGLLPFAKMSQLLGACDALLLPQADADYNRARWPHKFTDYLAAGRPVVGTAVGDTAPFIANQRLGRVARPEAADFAEKILEFCGARDEWAACGERSRKLAEGELSWERQLEMLRLFLLEIGAQV